MLAQVTPGGKWGEKYVHTIWDLCQSYRMIRSYMLCWEGTILSNLVDSVSQGIDQIIPSPLQPWSCFRSSGFDINFVLCLEANCQPAVHLLPALLPATRGHTWPISVYSLTWPLEQRFIVISKSSKTFVYVFQMSVPEYNFTKYIEFFSKTAKYYYSAAPFFSML